MAEYKAGPRRRRPTHPGAVVKGELDALALTPYAAAKAIGVTRQTLHNLMDETAAVSPAMALRLGKFFGNGAELWMKMQADVDLWDTRQKIAEDLSKIRPAKRPAPVSFDEG
jgi:addiction module HigA family antidote